MDDKKRVAICIDIPEFNGNRIFDHTWAKRFPGAPWMAVFKDQEKEVEVVTGDIALSNVQTGYWKADTVYVFQELDSFHGSQLIACGARPFVLAAGESPLYANTFYDQLPSIGGKFPNRILFNGAFEHIQDGKNNLPLFFPSFSLQEKMEITDWEKRKFSVLIASNKHSVQRKPVYKLDYPHRMARQYVRERRKQRSPHLITASVNSLHDARYSIVGLLASKHLIEVYGPGWDKKENYPAEAWKQLSASLPSIYKGLAGSKTGVMSAYKFCICFENTVYPGYITEKIIDCFFAGVIPVYKGAGDIGSFIPKELFVDYNQFSTQEELVNYLEQMPVQQAMTMINEARDYIYNKAGIRYSYEAFAKQVSALIHTASKSTIV